MDANACHALHHLCHAQRDEAVIDLTLAMIPLLPTAALNMAPLDGQLRGQTPLHIVAAGRDQESRRHEVIKLLIEHRADTEARDLNHRTPFLLAGGSAYRDGAEALHEGGANIYATKPSGRNFADEARGSNKKLANWWKDLTGLEETGAPNDRRPDMFRREGCSDARKQRARERWKQPRAKQPSMSRAVQTGGEAASSQQPDPPERVVLTERRLALTLRANDENNWAANYTSDSSDDDDNRLLHIVSLHHIGTARNIPPAPWRAWNDDARNRLAARGAALRSPQGRNRGNHYGHNRDNNYGRNRGNDRGRNYDDNYDKNYPWRHYHRNTSRRDRQNDDHNSQRDRRSDNDAWRSGHHGWQGNYGGQDNYGGWRSNDWQSNNYRRSYDGYRGGRGYDW